MLTIGSRIRLFGELQYPTVKAFADAMQMSPSNLQLYMGGRRMPGTPILTRLEAIGCNASWVLTGEGEVMRPRPGTVPVDRIEESGERSGRYTMTVQAAMLGPDTEGTFMEGDRLRVDPAEQPKSGDYVLVKGEEGPLLRRWERGVGCDGLVMELVRSLGVMRRR